MADENGTKMGQLLNFIAHNVLKKAKYTLWPKWEEIISVDGRQKNAELGKNSLKKF